MRRPLPFCAGISVGIIYLAVRYWLATTPVLAETYYDEALTGLMGLAILRGEPQVFQWGQPYLGAIEGYVAALGFWIAGASTLGLRMAEVVAALGWVWAVWSVTRRIAGEPWGFVAGLAVALPPVFLAFAQLSAYAQSLSVTLGAVALAAGAALLDSRIGARARMGTWILLGVAAGLGWWTSQMGVMFLAAVGLVLLVARPRTFLGPGPYVALGLFVATSLPFWFWNVQHEWATFRHLMSWGEPLPPQWSTRVERVADTLLQTLQGAFWDGKAVRRPPSVVWLGWITVATFYVPGVLLAAVQVARWVGRLRRRERPWQGPLDLVALTFWLTVGAHAATWFGTSGVLRYAMTFYATLPVLGAVALATIARRRPAGTAVAAAAVVAMLGYHGATHVLFVRQAAAAPWRPVDTALDALTRLGVRTCYADSRIAQVITFESGERIVCADYYGFRNYAFLQVVDEAADPDTVAIVTHARLRNPAPPVMAAALRRIGAKTQVERVGDFEIFHQVRPPDPRGQPVPPSSWRATASAGSEGAEHAFDRKVWTRWIARHAQDAWLQVDLGRPHLLAGLTLVVAPFTPEAPSRLRVETSLDGRVWNLVMEDLELMSGVHWWKGHARADEGGRAVVRIAPQIARYLRLRHPGAERSGKPWSIAELFVYEVADVAWVPPTAASAALLEARQALAQWKDDPAGPHPRRAPVTYAHRRAQVSWATVFAAATRATDTAPEWEEAHELYGYALWLSRWSPLADLALQQAWADGAWTEVLRWADVADVQEPAVWRSGRAAARAAALEALGRSGEAAVVRASVAERPFPLHVGFGDEVQLLALDAPPTARPGEAVTVRWAWRALRSMRDDYSGVLHLDQDGTRARFSHTQRLGHAFGSSWWAVGERIEETFRLTIPPDAVPGAYRLRLEILATNSRRHPRVNDADHHPGTGRHTTAPLATLTVTP